MISNTFNGNIESIVMEMAVIEIFCSFHVNKMWKGAFLLTGTAYSLYRVHWQLSLLDYIVKFDIILVNRDSEPLVGSKMVITLELKLCLSNFSRGIEKPKG